MNEELTDLIHELICLGKVAITVSGVCKANEPYVTITWDKYNSISGEFYSYCLDLSDGGRHHTFNVEHEVALLEVLKRFIQEAKVEIQKIKNRNWVDTCNDIEEQERMENEGG